MPLFRHSFSCALWQSFGSPGGRIGRLGFWWRQGVLALILFAGTLLYHAGDRLHHGRLFFQAVLEPVWAVVSACVTHFIAFLGGYEAAEHLTTPLLCEPVLPVPSQGCAMAMLVLGVLLLIAASWGCVALMLRRLRDTHLGLWWLPAYLLWWLLVCVPGASDLLIQYVDLNQDQKIVLGFLFFAFLHIVYCLPSSKERR